MAPLFRMAATAQIASHSLEYAGLCHWGNWTLETFRNTSRKTLIKSVNHHRYGTGLPVVSHSSTKEKTSERLKLKDLLVNQAKQGRSPVMAEPAAAIAEGIQIVSGRRGKRKKEYSPESQLRHDLYLCSRDNDLERALQLYSDHLAGEAGGKLNQAHYNVLLHLCASAAAFSTEDGRRTSVSECSSEYETNGGEVAGPQLAQVAPSIELQRLAAVKGVEIWEHMRTAAVEPNEASLTAAARLAMAKGDGDQAFARLKEMQTAGIPPKLRSFGPALFTFCRQGRVERAFEVDASMAETGVRMGEEELAALFKMCSEAGLSDRVYALLQRLRKSVRALDSRTVALIQDWFCSAPASRSSADPRPAGEVAEAIVANGGGWHGLGWLGQGAWTVKMVDVSSEGVCACCGEQLATIDLDARDTARFAEAVAALARERQGKSSEFEAFETWLAAHGPFEAIVDGANIGLCNQNFAEGGFNFWQLDSVVRAVMRSSPKHARPLVVLHHKRTRGGPAAAPVAQQILGRYWDAGALYTTPTGSNDDWYWLYAAVHHGAQLVTNDEMRDHLFQLLGTDFFPKWKERHQVRYSFSPDGLQLHMPPPYSKVLQESAQGAWHFPEAGNPTRWLCVTRPAGHDRPLKRAREDTADAAADYQI